MNPNIPPLYKPTEAPTASQTPAAAPAQTAAATAPSAPAPALSGEALMQRLRYFENLAEAYEAHIGVLAARVRQLGSAVPTAYFKPLTGVAGSYTPKVGG